MKPTQDTFTSHIQDLYKGYEVAAPASAQDGIFKQLDTIRIRKRTSKVALAAAAAVIIGAFLYLNPTAEEIQVELKTTVPAQVIDIVKEVPAAIEVSIEAPLEVSADISAEQVVVEVKEPALKTAVKTVNSPIKIQHPAVPVAEVKSDKSIKEDLKVVEDIVVEKVVETTESNPDTVVKIMKMENKAVEWVLPASLEVDE